MGGEKLGTAKLKIMFYRSYFTGAAGSGFLAGLGLWAGKRWAVKN
jgi:hypothetical protein